MREWLCGRWDNHDPDVPPRWRTSHRSAAALMFRHAFHTFKVPRFPVLRFPPLRFGPEFSSPALYSPAFSASPTHAVWTTQKVRTLSRTMGADVTEQSPVLSLLLLSMIGNSICKVPAEV